jgi:serine protease Do
LAGIAALAVLCLSPSVASADDETTAPTTSTSTTAPPTGSAVSDPTDEQKVAPYAQPGVVFVTIHWRAWIYDTKYHEYLNTNAKGQGLSTDFDGSCTGYVVNPEGWIATAGHCVSYKEIRQAYIESAVNSSLAQGWLTVDGKPATREYYEAYWLDHIKTESSDETGATGRPDRTVEAWWGADTSGIETEKGKPARVVSYQEIDQGDGALLKVDEHDMNALLLVPGDDTVDTLTPVAAIGYGASVDAVTDDNYNPSIKTGTVSSQKTIGGGLIPVYEINAQVTPGMSGGPTVNYEGRVIGTNSFFPRGEPQSFNFVGTSQRILELMASNGVTNELSEDTIKYREGIDAYFAGDKATAVADLTAVKEKQPSNAMVADYLERAQALPDQSEAADESEDGGTPAWVWVALAALLLLLVAGGGLLLGRGRRSTRQPAYATGYPVQPTQPPVPERQPEQYSPPHWQPGPAEPPDQQDQVNARADEPPAGQTQVMAAQPEQRRCPNCHEPVEEGKRFCGECGAPQ